MTGKSFVLFCLKKTHTKGHPLDVVLLYSQNELALLSQVRKRTKFKWGLELLLTLHSRLFQINGIIRE